METKIETITPERAAYDLKHLNRTNRSISHHRVKSYATQMKEGRWHLTHQGIAYNCDGTLRDGQHRLASVVKAGVPVEMMVTRGIPTTAMHGIDQGRPRQFVDVFNTQGVTLTHSHVALARLLFSVYREQVLGYAPLAINCMADSEMLLRFIEFHREAIDFAMQEANKNGIKAVPVRGAIAACWWTGDRDRLAEFRSMLLTGVIANQATDGMVLKLRDYVLNSTVSQAGIMRRELFGKACTALDHFMNRRNVSRLQWNKEAVFKLPHVPGINLTDDE